MATQNDRKMKRKHKILYSILAAPLFLIVFYYIGWSLAPGSYAKAEVYKFSIPEETLIEIIKEFKKENPSLDMTKPVRMKNGEEFYLEDGRRDSSDHWYFIYFYYPDKNQIVKTWTRHNISWENPEKEKSSSFAFVSISEGLTLHNWKTVNESFFWWKNTPLKEEFEKRILSGIKKKIKDKAKP